MTPSVQNFFYRNEPERKLDIIKVTLAISVVVLILILFVTYGVLGYLAKPKPSIPQTNPSENLKKAQSENQAASESALAKQNPLNQIQEAYSSVIGDNNLKKTLTLDENGVATIDYIIASNDGKFIIQTSYENFSDLAVRIFNINSVKRLNVTTYATKLLDNYGQPNIYAVQLGLTSATNAKINWSLKKYDYHSYATLLDYQQVNPLLKTDYQNLTKNKL